MLFTNLRYVVISEEGGTTHYRNNRISQKRFFDQRIPLLRTSKNRRSPASEQGPAVALLFFAQKARILFALAFFGYAHEIERFL